MNLKPLLILALMLTGCVEMPEHGKPIPETRHIINRIGYARGADVYHFKDNGNDCYFASVGNGVSIFCIKSEARRP